MSCARMLPATDITMHRHPPLLGSGTWASWTPRCVQAPSLASCDTFLHKSLDMHPAEYTVLTYVLTYDLQALALTTLAVHHSTCA